MNNNTASIVAGCINAIIILTIIFGTVYVSYIMRCKICEDCRKWYLLMWLFLLAINYFTINKDKK